jgi:hypothetical protein
MPGYQLPCEVQAVDSKEYEKQPLRSLCRGLAHLFFFSDKFVLEKVLDKGF